MPGAAGFFQLCDEIAGDELLMVKIVKQSHLRMIDGLNDFECLLDDHADQIFAMNDDIVMELRSGAGIVSRSKRGPLSKSSTTQTFEDAVG